ncbi:MAG TPA: aromatic ring-hydroxylating dioxygenase subunit alpha [Candidatus Sulfotelmatobacter sp.]|jgi:phenylpropionate dioxygenase-like ring-hydroxylating dioxygenase large terminal subunit|nr:aromatic ring-hydroxylating dioxygenase subunit alpha [Candidatus Sulfotelmatobacter sp.]
MNADAVSAGALRLPRDCTFLESDWRVLANYWYPIARSCDVTDKPLAARLLDQRLVIYRTSQGVSVANDLCLHRGAPLSSGRMEGDDLMCAYHGFRYDGKGQCVCIPAHPGAAIPPKLRLTTYLVAERYGLIWTCLSGQPANVLPEVPEWDDAGYQQANSVPLDLEASAGRQLEGFMDVAHFAWVHHNTFGDRNNPFVPNYTVDRTAHGLHVEYQSTVGNYLRQDGSESEPEKGVLRVFDCYLPFSARLTVHLPGETRLVILDSASPVSARRTRLFACLLRNYDLNEPLQPFVDYNGRIFNEDRDIVQSQYPEDLPIDLQEEVHIRADKTSIAYRQELGRLGLGRDYTS